MACTAATGSSSLNLRCGSIAGEYVSAPIGAFFTIGNLTPQTTESQQALVFSL
jgi:hypothetical protein